MGSGGDGLYFYWNESGSNFHFQLSLNVNVPIIGVNIRPALGHLFNVETLDIITGLSTGGLYHLQTETCTDLGNLNGDSFWNVLDIVALANCVLTSTCGYMENKCAADINGDGTYNVLDIVALANCVLAHNCD